MQLANIKLNINKLSPIPNKSNFLLITFLLSLVVTIVPTAIIPIAQNETIEYSVDDFPYLVNV